MALGAPGLLMLAALCLAPLVLLILKSLSETSGGLGLGTLADVASDAQYQRLLGRSLETALLVTLVSLALAWPVAWGLARHVGKSTRSLLLTLIMVPTLTSQLLLIYSMLVLLGAEGPLMTTLDQLGLADAQSSILYTPWATRLMLVYESIPVIILILTVSFERLDDAQLAASRSLGAGAIRTFLSVIWPACSVALTSAVSITFVATAGAFAEAAVLGGPHGSLLGNALADRLRSGAAANVSASLAVVLLVASLACVAVMAVLINRVGRPAGGWSTRRPAGVTS
jgi:spermidine/putrescine transport system permease protein